MSEVKVRRTQEERSATTRARLLAAASTCLLEHGYAETTIARVQDAAGVARGTLLHHFPTRADLMVAATVHLVEQRMAAFRDAADRIGDGDRLQAVVDLAWRDLSSPEFYTALELWVAARTDPDLKEVLLVEEDRLFRTVLAGTSAALGPAYADDPRVPTVVELTIDVLTGLSMMSMLTGSLGHREVLLRRWRATLGILLGELDASTLLDDPQA